MTLERLGREHVEPDTADARCGAREEPLDHLGLEPDGLEDLRAAVGLDRRDAHLRDRLQQRFAKRFDEVRGRLDGVDVDLAALGADALDRPLVEHEVIERLEHQVRLIATAP